MAPLAFSPVAFAAELTPVDPRPAPGLPAQVNAQIRGLSAAPGPTRPKTSMTMTQYRAQKVRWSAKNCTKATLAAKVAVKEITPKVVVECATVKTPLSWSDLSKGSMDLHFSRVRSTTPTKKAKARVLFVNPGGPGGAAGPMAVSVAATATALRKTHDIVGVDPRGTGGSTALNCPPKALGVSDSRVLTSKVRNEARTNLKNFVAGCVKKYDAYLPHITTLNTVSDHDLVRQLLAGRTVKADWYGVSGGSWMGAWYAQRYPNSLERVVLDANTEFTADWRTSFAAFPMGFQRRFEGQFLPWMARQSKQFKAGSTTKQTKAAYERVRAAAGKGKITGMRADDVDAIVMMLMYSDDTFPLAAQFIAGTDAALRKNGKTDPAIPKEFLEAMGKDADASALTVRTAILCNDTPYTRTPASYEQEFRGNIARYPLVAGMHDMVMAGCAYWPYKPAAAPKIDGTRGPVKLMVQTEFDPATPIEGARKAHAANARTRMITVAGAGGHGGYLAMNPCVDKAVNAYLTKGTMPTRDLTCAGTPLPNEKKVFPVTWKP